MRGERDSGLVVALGQGCGAAHGFGHMGCFAATSSSFIWFCLSVRGSYDHGQQGVAIIDSLNLVANLRGLRDLV